ncbi:MAG: hypothetical protein HOC23_13335 [Halieaceae bacterium]|jgi:hypothetical protein|nr:hypothetical protein [Halieaceae bacterium]
MPVKPSPRKSSKKMINEKLLILVVKLLGLGCSQQGQQKIQRTREETAGAIAQDGNLQRISL